MPVRCHCPSSLTHRALRHVSRVFPRETPEQSLGRVRGLELAEHTHLPGCFVTLPAPVVSLYMANCARHDRPAGECRKGCLERREGVCVSLVVLLRELLFQYCLSPGKRTSLKL